MMKNDIRATTQKHLVPKIFAQLAQVERAIKRIAKSNDTDTQLTLLAKLGQTYYADMQMAEEMNREIKTYWSNLLGPKTDSGFFHNRELGAIFVAGPLSEQFLHDIDGKKLGALTEGPYGILRGLGIPEPEAADDIKKLNKGQYLLLIRTIRVDINGLEDTLGKTG